MSDQADTLRRLMEQRQSEKDRARARGEAARASRVQPRHLPKVITVASGKGGVGKSCFSATMGTMLARNGFRVLLVDGDFGLANLDILLNVQPIATLEQVMDGVATIQEAVLGVEPNLWLIPAASGLMDYKQASAGIRENLLRVFENCPWEMDFIFVDAGAGVQENVLSLHSTEFESVVMLTPEPTAFTDAYGLIKLLRRQAGIRRANVIVNQVTDGREGTQTFQKLKDVAAKFVDVELEYLGHWQRDEKITEAVMKRKILLDLDIGALSVPSLQLLAKRFQAKFLGQVDDMKRTVPVSANSLRTGRFRNEPAQMAPGNTAGFFRTLLGEVKA
jgi:flagellar biosynthesis protein FlhG